MKNQPNDMVTIEWLLPLFNEQLIQFADSWQSEVDEAVFTKLQEHYRQLSGALIMANLPRLGALANQLSGLAAAGIRQPLSKQEQLMGQFSHQLLYYELLQGAQTGSYRGALLTKTIEVLTANIAKVLTEQSEVTDTFYQTEYDAFDAKKSVNITVPKSTSIFCLQANHYHHLLMMWRHQSCKLLAANSNQPSILAPLATVSHYLWQSIDYSQQQQLWYGAEQWLQNLAQNDIPLPEHYAVLLTNLEQIIQTYYSKAKRQDSLTVVNGENLDEDANPVDLSNACLTSNAINSVINEIYIQLSRLATVDSSAQTLLIHTPEANNTSINESSISFLARLLIDVETIIFSLEVAHDSVTLLKQLQRQLKVRGWSQYEAKVGQIVEELTAFEWSTPIEDMNSKVLSQIKQQLQFLYDEIHDTVQALDHKVAIPAPQNITSDLDTHLKIGISQLRHIVTTIRQHFMAYIQQKDPTLLPSANYFLEISNTFKTLRLPDLQSVVDKIAAIFEQIAAHAFKELGWQLTQALAEGLSAIDLLLEHLTLHIIDQSLLCQVNTYITNAETLLAALIVNPAMVLEQDTEREIKNAQRLSSEVIRYDDNGEIAPSKAWQPQPADCFLQDDELRDTFIEEADDVIGDVEDFLSIWKGDTQDLTSLMEVRRGFHLLKGSGRMVGAMSVSEVAWAIENLLNHVLDRSLLVTDQVVNLVLNTTQQLSVLVTDFAAQRSPSCDPTLIISQCKNLVAGRPLLEGVSTSDLKLSMTEKDFQNHDESMPAKKMPTKDNNGSDPNSINLIHKPLHNNIEKTTGAVEVIEQENSNQKKSALNNASSVQCDLSIPNVLLPFIEATQDLPADTQDADADIKEIFIEEAGEVLAGITPLYDLWQQSPDDLTHLPDIRRGFHTLKGSGRMVGALYTAELAWAIEEMLNRLLDHTIEVSTDIFQLIGDVLAIYPELIQTFAEDIDGIDSAKSYPFSLPLWVACARAYSQQLGDKFSYAALSHQYLKQSDIEGSSNQMPSTLPATLSTDDKTGLAQDEAIDYMLQTFHSVNEMIADAPIVLTIDSKEEQYFCQIFVDEAKTLLKTINQFINDNEEQSQIEVSDEIVRAFHTLRAASGSKALVAISEVSAAIEQSLEQLQQQEIMMNAEHLQALTQSVALIESYLFSYEQCMIKQNQSSDANTDFNTDNDIVVRSQEELTALQAMLGKLQSMPKGINSQIRINALLDINIDELLDADANLVQALSHLDETQIKAYIDLQRDQIARLAAHTKASPKFSLILGALDNAYHYLSVYPYRAQNKDIQTLLVAGHTQLLGLFDSLAGSMSLKIDAQVIVDLQALAVSDVTDTPHIIDVSDGRIATDGDSTASSGLLSENSTEDLTIQGNDSALPVILKSVDSRQEEVLQLEEVETDSELLEIFLEEAQDIDSAIAQTFSKWRTDIHDVATLKILQRYLHTIKGGARMAGIASIGNLTDQAEMLYSAFVESRIQPTLQWLMVMQVVQDILSLQIDYVGRYRESFFAKQLIEQLKQLEADAELPVTLTLILPALQNHLNAHDSNNDDKLGAFEKEADEKNTLDTLIAQSWLERMPDLDILEVYLEEADELVANSNKYLQLFLNNISDVVALQTLQRDLHTIKGGARMVAANGIADLAHEMETVYEELAVRRRPATKMISQLLTACHDWLADAVFVLKSHVNPPNPRALISALQQFSKNPDSLKSVPIESLQTQLSAIFAAKTKRESIRGVDNIALMPSMSGNFTEQDQISSNNEMIRISGNLIERMINLSGESAINRARIDMGMSSLTVSIEEMGTTVQRLADQLRRMESELEQQILSQIDDADLVADEGFDPLEMDQYSSLNQLSKSLSESASDLIDINSTLLEKTRDSENLLLQLSRTQTELQDGLMNSRMVPFARLTPRLERIVRQTANELNKSVELTIINADDEMDRTILERITSPLEHMLRNAVDHGIESPQIRLNAGKDRSGHITLEVLREGSEVVINLTDDGRGISVDAVREKAIAQGLIDVNDDSLSDLDVMQYIFNAGVTTTNKITQISGRGVGMNVVMSEARQLGGVVSVTSNSGQGSCFTMRVPLTVAVSDALVVRAADRYYAIPLVQIERVVRVNPEKLFEYYQSDVATMRIEEQDYRVRYLNEILTGKNFNELLINTNSSLPVIIIKNRSGQKLALQVDQIAGSRIEVVVKPLGKQLSHVAGISAATIMGDGSVMMILDLIALLRNAPAIKDVPPTVSAKGVNNTIQRQQPVVLVVDDSVTVRKVTSRFLERQGITAVVAKDGIDAIEILQELTPDLILLDIEMPRMDGFEVATQVRFNQRLRNIPIIMITSRTGEKHRERAFEIGVNGYMGKPFQEKELLRNIQNLLNINLVANYDKEW